MPVLEKACSAAAQKLPEPEDCASQKQPHSYTLFRDG